MGNILDYLGGFTVIIKSLRSENLPCLWGEGLVSVEERSGRGSIAPLEQGGSGHDPGIVGNSKSWKRQGNGSSPRASR